MRLRHNINAVAALYNKRGITYKNNKNKCVMEKKKKKYIIEAWAEGEYLEYRTYEIEAESEEDAKERFREDGLIIDTVESDCDTHSVKVNKIYEEI